METEQEQKTLFKCWKCLKEFENTDNLNIDYNREDKEKHDTENNLICDNCQEQDFRNKNELITEKHDTEETALNVQNYPYGFRLKTTIRYYIETTKRGDRFVSQTLNPKTNEWNTPKKSTYSAVEVLIKEKETGYIRTRGLNFTTDRTEILNFLDFIKDYELNKEQQEQIRILKAYCKVYENVSYTFRTRTDDEEKEKEEDQKQEEIKKQLNKAVGYYYKTEEF